MQCGCHFLCSVFQIANSLTLLTLKSSSGFDNELPNTTYLQLRQLLSDYWQSHVWMWDCEWRISVLSSFVFTIQPRRFFIVIFVLPFELAYMWIIIIFLLIYFSFPSTIGSVLFEKRRYRNAEVRSILKLLN